MNSVKRKPFDRIPFSLGMTGEMAKKLTEYTGYEYGELIYGVFDCDRRGGWVPYIGPQPAHYDDGSYDTVYGVRMRSVSYGSGQYDDAVAFPLMHATTVEEVRKHPWPKAEWYNYDAVLNPLQKYPDYPFMLGYQAIGWFSWDMRGMDLFMTDLHLEEAIATAIIEQVSDIGYEYFKRLLETAKGYDNFAAIQLADDWGTQHGLLIGVPMFRKFFKAHYRRIIDMAHSAGKLVEFHCCGHQVPLIPEFIDLGVDILNPLQTSAKDMVPHVLKREFGRHIAFSGGVDVQTVLPHGTAQQVRDEVFYLLDSMAGDGGYILEPSHAIQVDTPPENVLAMVGAVYEYYGINRGNIDDFRRQIH